MFGFLRRRKRKKLLQQPFPDHWPAILEQHLPFYARLKGDDRQRFHDNLKVFVWERSFIGAKGLEVTDEHRVVIAAAAVRLVQKLDISVYDRLTEIVVYPYDYQHPDGTDIVLGEAHHWGVVVLSWPAVLSGIHNPCDGWDTAMHEFAHVLDRNSGAFNGTPPLRASAHYRPWAEVMQRRFDKLRAGSAREHRVMRNYGAKNEAEFFAVATEAFFERPRVMKQLTPDLYDELKQFYGVDPEPEC
ncbi:MAG: M90 family metallopeptidase [bacterium]